MTSSLPYIDPKVHRPAAYPFWSAVKEIERSGHGTNLFTKRCQFQVEVQPSSRNSSYTVDTNEIWLWGLSGTVKVHIIDGSKSRSVTLEEGYCYLVPGNVPRILDSTAGEVMSLRQKVSDSELHWAVCGKCLMITELKTEEDVSTHGSGTKTCQGCEGALLQGPATQGQEIQDGGKSPKVNMETHPDPFHLRNHIDSIRDQLKPPVGNKMVYGKGCQLKVMVVGGPNTRTDYHIDEGEEWFLQLQGKMCLKVVDGGEFRDVIIEEGNTFLLPGLVPHSPQRFPHTIGLVIEREREESELDGLRWYCPNCRDIMYEERFHCTDLGSQLAPVIKRYYGTEELRTCKNCGAVEPAK
eukprot:Clim_evm33s253 gene=Clim_evmTU33s253